MGSTLDRVPWTWHCGRNDRYTDTPDGKRAGKGSGSGFRHDPSGPGRHLRRRQTRHPTIIRGAVHRQLKPSSGGRRRGAIPGRKCGATDSVAGADVVYDPNRGRLPDHSACVRPPDHYPDMVDVLAETMKGDGTGRVRLRCRVCRHGALDGPCGALLLLRTAYPSETGALDGPCRALLPLRTAYPSETVLTPTDHWRTSWRALLGPGTVSTPTRP